MFDSDVDCLLGLELIYILLLVVTYKYWLPFNDGFCCFCCFCFAETVLTVCFAGTVFAVYFAETVFAVCFAETVWTVFAVCFAGTVWTALTVFSDRQLSARELHQGTEERGQCHQGLG